MPTIEVPTVPLTLRGLEPRYLEIPKIAVPLAGRSLIETGSDDFNRANEDLEVSGDWTRIRGNSGDLRVSSNNLTGTNANHHAIYRYEKQTDAVAWGAGTNIKGQALGVRSVGDAPGYSIHFSGSLSNRPNALHVYKGGYLEGTFLTSLPWNVYTTNDVLLFEAIDEGSDVRLRFSHAGIEVFNYLDTTDVIPTGGFATVEQLSDFGSSPSVDNVVTYLTQSSGIGIRGWAPSLDQQNAFVQVPGPGTRVGASTENFDGTGNLEVSARWAKEEGTSWTLVDGRVVSTSISHYTYSLDSRAIRIRQDDGTLRYGFGYVDTNTKGYEFQLSHSSGSDASSISVTRDNTPTIAVWNADIPTGVPIVLELDDHILGQVTLRAYVNGVLIGTVVDATPITGRNLRALSVSTVNTTEAQLNFFQTITNSELKLVGLVPEALVFTAEPPTGSLVLTGLVPTVRFNDPTAQVPTAGGLVSQFTDAFTRADEALDASSDWEEVETGLQLEILTNEVGHVTDDTTPGVYTIPEATYNFSDNQAAKLTLNEIGAFSDGDGYGVVLRADGTQKIYGQVEFGGFNFTLSDGTVTDEAAVNPFILDGDSIDVEVLGDVATAYWTHVSDGSREQIAQITTTTVLTGGQPGIYAEWNTTATPQPLVDDFEAWDNIPGIQLTGLVPAVILGPSAFPPAGSLTLTGLVPTVVLSDNQLIQVPLKGGFESQFTDAFTRADEDLDANSNWGSIVGPGTPKWILASNEITLNASGLNSHAVEVEESVYNYGGVQAAQATITALGSGMGFTNSTTFGVGCRMTSTPRGVAWGWSSDGTRVRLISVFNGTENGAKTISPTLAVGDKIRLEVDSNNNAHGFVQRVGSSDWDEEATWATDLVVAGHLEAGGQPGVYHNMADLGVTSFAALDDFEAFQEIPGIQIIGLVPTVDIVANDVLVDVPVGAMTLTGFAPTVTVPISVPTGALALTGFAPFMRPVVPTGALALAGLAPAILNPNATDVPAGSLSLTGLVPDVLNPAGAEIPVGSLSFTGFAPFMRPVVPTGALTLLGLEPVTIVGDDQTILVPIGSMTLVGLAPLLSFDIAIPVGAMTLTGLAPQPKLSTDEDMSWVVEPELGAVTLTGQAPTLRDDYNIPAGVLSFTGLVPSVEQDVVEDVPVGAMVLAGQAPTVLNPHSVDVPTGSLALTGLVPTVEQDVVEDVPAGSITFTGLVPSVEQDVVENIPAGTLTLTGLAPTVGLDVLVDVPVGSLALTGFAPFMRPVVPTGALTFTGLEPVVIVGDDQTILVPAGSMTLTGLAPTALTPRTVDVPVGSISFTGLVPAALAPRLVDVPTGSLSLTGLVPAVLAPGVVNVPTGAMILAGLVPTILNPAGAEVPTGALTLTGLVPNVLNAVTVPVPAGALTLTGLAPTVEQDVLENVPTGALTLTGLQPIAINPQGMVVPTGTLTLTGLVPTAPVSIVVPVPAGALTLTGLAPTVEQDIVENIPTGSLAITGLVPVIDLTDLIVVDVPVGSLSVAGLQPTAFTPRTVDVPVGSLSMVGLAPTVDISAAPLIIPTGTLTLAGFAPEIVISADVVVEVPTGVLVFTGYPPILFGQTFEVPTGSLLLTGLAPRIQFARDYSTHTTYKRYYNAWTDGGEGRVFKVGSDEGTDIQ